MDELILSLDVGTTVVKSVLLDNSGKEAGVAERGCRLLTPAPGFVELDPEEVWAAVLSTIRDVITRVDKKNHIQAVAISTQGGSVLGVDHQGEPTCAIMTWLDNRAQNLVEGWRQGSEGGLIRSICGWHPEAGLPMPMIGWMHQNRPEVFNRTARWLSVNDFLTFRLAGVYSMNPSMAGEMLLADIDSGKWSEDLCHLVGIHPDQLSPVLPSDAIVGGIVGNVAEATGLIKGTPVVNGGQDHSCEALALGINDTTRAFLACGTAWVINGVTNCGMVKAVPDGMNLNFHVLPGLWIVSQFLGGLGAYPEWCVKQMWQDEEDNRDRGIFFDKMNKALEGAVPQDDQLIFLPLGGSSQTVHQSRSGGFIGLRIDHTRQNMSRAVLETGAFEVRWALDYLKIDKIDIRQMWMIGGAARSPVWPQILADVNGIDISLTSYSHGPALGAAMLAYLALGIFNSASQCYDHFKVDERLVHPNKDNYNLYQKKFDFYRRLTEGYETFSS